MFQVGHLKMEGAHVGKSKEGVGDIFCPGAGDSQNNACTEHRGCRSYRPSTARLSE